MTADPHWLRARLADARLMLLFTPSLCGERDPLDVLAAALPSADLVQVRVKAGSHALSAARETYDWTARVLAQVAGRAPVLVDDRVDVAAALLGRGCAGVHLGRDDLAVERARALLGPGPLIGFSTHRLEEVVDAQDSGADYLGFGPVFPTSTKNVERGLGAEAAWVAQAGSRLPVFPIGGIGRENANELARVGRAAASSAILGAADPGAAARALRELLGEA